MELTRLEDLREAFFLTSFRISMPSVAHCSDGIWACAHVARNMFWVRNLFSFMHCQCDFEIRRCLVILDIIDCCLYQHCLTERVPKNKVMYLLAIKDWVGM